MKLKKHKKLSIMLFLSIMLLCLTLYSVNTVNFGVVILRPWSVMTFFIG